MNFLRLSFFALLTLSVAQVHAEDAAEKPTGDLLKLQGKWRLVSLEVGQKVNEVPGDAEPFIIAGRELKNKDNLVAEITLHPGENKPALGDFKLANGSVLEGIYELEADTWKVCVNTAAGEARERPASFTTEPAGYVIVKFERVRE